MADITERNGLYPLEYGRNVFGHRDWSATMCPGVLYTRLPEICSRVNKLIEGTDNGEDSDMAAIDAALDVTIKDRIIEDYYIKLLGRNADIEGEVAQLRLAAKDSIRAAAKAIALSGEAANRDAEQRVISMYYAFLGRYPESNEAVSGWVDVANAQGWEAVFAGIHDGEEATKRRERMGL